MAVFERKKNVKNQAERQAGWQAGKISDKCVNYKTFFEKEYNQYVAVSPEFTGRDPYQIFYLVTKVISTIECLKS